MEWPVKWPVFGPLASARGMVTSPRIVASINEPIARLDRAFMGSASEMGCCGRGGPLSRIQPRRPGEVSRFRSPGRVGVNHLNQGDDVLDGGVGQDAMAQVEDVSGAAGGLVE